MLIGCLEVVIGCFLSATVGAEQVDWVWLWFVVCSLYVFVGGGHVVCG